MGMLPRTPQNVIRILVRRSCRAAALRATSVPLSVQRKVFLSAGLPLAGARRPIIVLGCRVRLGREGGLMEGALLRRVRAAASVYFERTAQAGQVLLLASGGRRWSGHVEADVIARELARQGVPPRVIVRERLSMCTRENARFVAEVLERRGFAEATVVTCEWHVARALLLFRRAGVAAEGVAVADPETRWGRRLLRWGKERALAWVNARGGS